MCASARSRLPARAAPVVPLSARDFDTWGSVLRFPQRTVAGKDYLKQLSCDFRNEQLSKETISVSG